MTSKRKIPLWVILLDIVGSLFVAGGIFGLVAEAGSALAGGVNLNQLAIPLIVLGVLLMVPLVIFAVKLRR